MSLASLRSAARLPTLARALAASRVTAYSTSAPLAQAQQPAAAGSAQRPRPAHNKYQKKEALTRTRESQRHPGAPPHFITLADLSAPEVEKLVREALAFKLLVKTVGPRSVQQSFTNRSAALVFSKRSTRTRVASETSVVTLGGTPMFLGSQDIQLGVNETLEDSARVISSMVDGIMARVGAHSEIETLAQYSSVPVINALSDLYHPTQILADILTLVETYSEIAVPEELFDVPNAHSAVRQWVNDNVDVASVLKDKKVAWVGDTNNIINEIIVTLPRLGATVSVASPKGYDKVDPRVWDRITDAGTESKIILTNSPAEALKDADVVVTDTWISMGQEDEKAARISAFAGYQLTNELINGSGAKPDWKFLHCLPRKQEEVNDEVFYGDRSLVFPEAENRKWTIMAVFDAYFGKWQRA
ncbi:hypothetical protein VHUM_01479 [Vanrija humicola]|uniref:ornithine carbamoyltransferase n=1 Tax=Vanrija humicola TaxID=5417 RepID=A0A7D8V3S9_VANHU|nr:hypothetical protein VHUM_01479 [Vanrija humicola]